MYPSRGTELLTIEPDPFSQKGILKGGVLTRFQQQGGSDILLVL
jgi:hypothetical protein